MKKSIYASCIVMLFSGAVAFADNENYDGQDVSGKDFSGKTMQESSWVNSIARGTNFNLSDLTDANFGYATLTGAIFRNATVKGANFCGASGFTETQLKSTKSYQEKDLSGINLSQNDLSGWDFYGQNLTGADFTNATVKGASFYGANGLTEAQLKSTKSYQEKDLSGINLGLNDLSGLDVSGLNLTSASFGMATLTGTNFTNAIVKRTDFGSTVSKGFTEAQLKSTKSYQEKDLSGIRLGWNDLSGWNFSGQNLTSASFASAALVGANFTNANLTSANFLGAYVSSSDGGSANFTNATVKGANLSGASGLTEAQLKSTKSYQEKDLSGINFSYNDLSGWNFREQNLTSANFEKTTLTSTDLSGADLTGVNFSYANLGNTNFKGANLTNTTFLNTELASVNFTDAIIKGANFCLVVDRGLMEAQLKSTKSYQEKDLSGINFSKNDFIEWDFSGQNLTSANFYQADFKDVSFANANLTDANFEGLNASGVDGGSVDFTGANLIRANFENAGFRTVDFTCADLRGANMSDIHRHGSGLWTYKNTIMSDGVIKNFSMRETGYSLKIRKYTPVDEGGVMISAKVSEADAVVSGGSKLELDVGAVLEVVNNRVLYIKDAGELIINTDLAGSTSLSVSGGAGLSFGEGGKLIVNLTESITGEDAYSFAVVSWFDDSKMSGLSDFVVGENLILTVQGENYAGAWNYIINGNSLVINLGAVPEPATYAVIFGAAVLAFIMWRKRK